MRQVSLNVFYKEIKAQTCSRSLPQTDSQGHKALIHTQNVYFQQPLINPTTLTGKEFTVCHSKASLHFKTPRERGCDMHRNSFFAGKFNPGGWGGGRISRDLRRKGHGRC